MAVFDETPTENPLTDPLETLVGEGRKYKNTSDLAKAYTHADQTIAERNDELARLRAELDSRLSVEEQLRKFDESRQNVREPALTPQGNNQGGTALSDEDLANRIKEVTQRQSQEATAKQNVEDVAQRMEQLFGEKANEVVRNKARELGVSVEFLQAVAAKSPRAFYAQVGVEVTNARNSNPAPRSDLNTAALSSHSSIPQPGSYSFYENLRKTSPKVYWDPKTQNQLHKDALRVGESFFET